MSRRIRIFFIGCPTLDVHAASHLLLSQNAVQSAVQFEIYHYWIFSQKAHDLPKSWIAKFLFWYGEAYSWLPFSKKIGRSNLAWLDYHEAPSFKSELNKDRWFDACKDALQAYDSWFKKANNQYDVVDCPSIIVTEAPISGGYISFTNKNIGLISTARWKSFFKPVSALDYILFATQRLTMRLAFTQEVGSHYPTRGCLWDYDDHQPDARIAILLGHICQTCKAKLLASADEHTYNELTTLVANRWLGDKSVQFTPASILAHVYKYDLSRSTGLHANFFSKLSDSLIPELGKILSDAIKWALVLIITLTLAAYFPSILSKIKHQLSDSPVSARSDAQ